MSVVIDASAAMALMLGERGADVVERVVRRSFMSAVNVSECCARGVERGATADEVLAILRRYEIDVVVFDLEAALNAAGLRQATRAIGASFGDRACLALGRQRAATIYTSDHRMSQVDPTLGIDVRLIR